MTTFTASGIEEQRAASGGPAQNSAAELMERIEFNEAYVNRLRDRDAGTWQHFDDFFRPRIRAKFRAKFSWESAEDHTAATMLALIESIDRGEPKDPSCLAGYVFSTCHNKMLATWRILGKENHVEFDFELLRDREKTPLETWISKEESTKISRVLSKLSEKDRDILVCVHYYGQDRDEVCQRYGVEREHLKMILFHARKRFQREWRRD